MPTFDGLGKLALSGTDCVIDTDDGTISCVRDSGLFAFAAIEQRDGGTVGRFAAEAVFVDQSAQVKVRGSRPLVLVAKTTIEIAGALDATAQNREPNGGGFAQSAPGQGGGRGGGQPLRNYNAAGGGAFCGRGGNGGFVAAEAPAALGGLPFGSPMLIPLFGGASGGGSTDRVGGAGGGAIQLVAGDRLWIGLTGSVSAGGGGGLANGGAGGSGGALLLEAPTVHVDGALTANGGGGAIFNGGSAGQDGQPSALPALGSAASAGRGSAGSAIAGADGDNDGKSPNSSGGGGGGAGRIRINTRHELEVGDAALFSPGRDTVCVTTGALGR